MPPIRSFISFFALLAVLFPLVILAQGYKISGRIVDAETLDPLPYAHVFIDQTTIGAVSDLNGEYTLENIENGDYKLVFSFVAYELFYKVASVNGKDIRVSARLIPQKEILQNVEVKGTRDKTWETQLKQFNRVFFGENSQAKDCKILNPWVLEFEYNKETKIFTAQASAPLEIENMALGYHIVCNLQLFSFDKKSYKIKGLYKFDEINTLDSKEASRWTRNRKQAYQTSIRFLMKSIVEHRATENGFTLYSDNRPDVYTSHSGFFSSELEKNHLTPLRKDDWVVPSGRPGYYNIKFDKRLEIHHTTQFASTKTYRDVPNPVSWIEVEKGPLLVSEHGFVVNNEAVVTSGELNKNRIAAMLPINYSPGNFVVVNYLTKRNTARRLQERSYLQLDKVVYYPGEHIWFKAHMNYANQSVKDSLSQVLYIDLVDASSKIIESKILKIDSMGARGKLLIKAGTSPGQYYLRTYTNWMQNYGPTVIGYVPIIVSDNQVKTISQVSEAVQDMHDFIWTVQMNNQDSSTLFVALDSSLYSESAICAVSITPVGANSPHELKKFKSAMFFDENLPEESVPDLIFPLESGFSLSGKVVGTKKRAVQSTLTVIEGKMDSLYTIKTSRNGLFTIHNLDFYDSTTFSFQARNKKRSIIGKTYLTTLTKPAPKLPTKKLIPVINTLPLTYPIQLVKPIIDSIAQMERLPDDGNPEKKTARISNADYILTEEDLDKMPASLSIVTALAGRIPGLQILPSGSVSMRGANFNPTENTEPLFVVDGIPFFTQQLNKKNQGSAESQQTQTVNSPESSREAQAKQQNSTLNTNEVKSEENLNVSSSAEMLGHITVSTVSRVEVTKKMDPLYGSLGANGVIAIYTKRAQGKGSDVKVLDVYTVEGFLRPMAFKQAVNYSSNPITEYTPTWYWNPDVRISHKEFAKIGFPTLPRGVSFQVSIAGITKSGKAVTAIIQIDNGFTKSVRASLDQRQK